METIWMIQKAAAVGNWSLAASPWQCACSCITHALCPFLVNHQITQMIQPAYNQNLAPLRLTAFSKAKINFERKEISGYWWDSGKYDGAANGDWENCVRSQGLAYLEGNWGIIVICTVFLVSLINFSSFHSTLLDTFWTGLVYWVGPKVHLFSSVRRR